MCLYVLLLCKAREDGSSREPSINQHRDEEEEENHEAGGTRGPRDGAGLDQRAVDEAVDVDTSGIGLGHGNVAGNTLGDSIVRPGRKVTFSLGVSTPPGRGGQTIGHMSPGRGAREPQGRGREIGPTRGNAREGSTYHAFPSHNSNNFSGPASSEGPPLSGRSSYEQEAGRSRGHD